jgi:hypothetical protein
VHDIGNGRINYAACQADDDMIYPQDFQAAGRPARQCCFNPADVQKDRTVPTYRHSFDVNTEVCCTADPSLRAQNYPSAEYDCCGAMPGRLSDHGVTNNGNAYRHTTAVPDGVVATGDDNVATVALRDQALTFYRHK